MEMDLPRAKIIGPACPGACLLKYTPEGGRSCAPARDSIHGHRVLLDVFRPRRGAAAADVVERLGILDAVALAQHPAAGEDELADVIAIRRHVVVAEEREALAALGQLGPQPEPLWNWCPTSAFITRTNSTTPICPARCRRRSP